MKDFKLYGFINKKKVLITDSRRISPSSTFDEQLSIHENMKAEMAFNFSSILNDGTLNPNLKLIYPMAKLRLEYYNPEIYTIDFIVSNISPDFYRQGNILKVKAEDLASFLYVKEGVGFSLNSVGNILELTQEVLVRTRKNLGYRDLIKNYLNFSSFISKTSNLTTSLAGFKYTFNNNGVALRYNRNSDIASTEFTFSYNVLNTPSSNIRIKIEQFNSQNIRIDDNQDYLDFSTKGLKQFDFRFLATTTTYRIAFHGTTSYLSVNDLKIKLKVNPLLLENQLTIENLDPNNFLTDDGLIQKATLEIKDSNLYNALVEIANIFNADIQFNYSDLGTSFSYINKKNRKYKGYKILPEFNLTTFNREENVNEFYTVLNIKGSNDVLSMFPPIPKEFSEYLYDCILNDFSSAAWFENYDNQKYIDLVPTVATYISTDDIYEERLEEITKFAKSVDLVPNFENTIYNIDYFYNMNKINTATYNIFNNYIKNDFRKLNIKIRLYSTLYYNAQSLLTAQESEISFYCRNITTEKFNIKSIEERLSETDETTGELLIEENSTRWIAAQNQLENSLDAIQSYTRQLLELMAFKYDSITLEPYGLELENQNGSFYIKSGTYGYNLLNIHGFYNFVRNGIQERINEIRDKIISEHNLMESYRKRVTEIDNKLDAGVNDYIKTALEVERSGLNSRIEASEYSIGIYTTDPFEIDENNGEIKGELQNHLHYLEKVYNYSSIYYYRKTLIDYSKWVNNTIPANGWGYTGEVSTAVTSSFVGVDDYDLMMRVNDGSTVYSNTTSLSSTQSYRVSALIRPNAVNNSFQIIMGTIGNPTLTINSSILTTGQWIGVEYYPYSNETYLYSFPSYAPILTGFSATYGTATTGTTTISFKLNGTSGYIDLYRPRLEVTSNLNPSLDEMFSLSDNPKMINYEEKELSPIVYTEGLYDLLYNYDYIGNLPKQKEEIVNVLYKDFEEYITEGYYENSDEITSEGLLKQALIAFENTQYPKITYQTQIIDISTLEDYKNINVNVGDKIIIAERENNLYNSYNPNEATKYLDVSSLSIPLRQPESTSITIQEDDETTRILQKLLSNL